MSCPTPSFWNQMSGIGPLGLGKSSGGIMFENDVPKHKIGVLHPLSIIDNSPYEFYRLAPTRVMLVMISVGLAEFSKGDVERVFAPLDSYLDQLMERGIE